MNFRTLNFLKECYRNYLPEIRQDVPDFPERYVYPDGNPVKPVLPVQVAINKIMLIGAFPSARFEKKW
jgi:hypothetical protein